MFIFRIFSALEQFNIFIVKGCTFLLLFSLTNFVVFLIVAFLSYFLLWYWVIYYNKIIFNNIYLYFNKLYLFVLGLINDNISSKEYKFLPYLLVLFLLFSLINLLGLIPFTFTTTSHISFTLTFSLLTFFTATYLSLNKHGVEFFSLFLPANTPIVIVPFLIIIEIISYFARLFSLAIRLFANMMSGHTLLHILAKFGGIMLGFGGGWILGGFIPVCIVFIIFFLEASIAILQSYVFSILFCIYLGDGINLH